MTQIQQTVFVVEDDEAVRDSLALLLESEGLPVKTFDSGADFLERWSAELNGCIVLDIRMPGMDGMAVQKALNERGSLLPVIFVTGHGDVPLAVEAMRHGAVDFIEKPYRDSVLLEKVRAALTEHAEQRALSGQQDLILERIRSMTPREREIMDRMVEGQANKVIAIELEISQRTVEIHRSRVMHKMGTHSLAQLVRMVMAVRDKIA
ncbi:response regulator FixJ [Hydrocarboniclastica marina]|uniref:DNA-binding response regulator n=1 Tax=Hydrocarboniclastica marina TaxID=2259620 RepID=A0A4V1D8J4_9ALTE|nr:response regulator FixJ [Hydrocarboniclastica marina]MAL96980.1 DNA-binding response regulator [Alteromonadaceae bacterium]QCF25400.1 DNA-binding response regulator [Hydrocarboniclastica marina]|tara:strand:+ start:4533 stop:5153 length:621 start_codon:yes stop_codon:yes gene_type:complete